MPSTITLVECPRDAMQGWKTMIPTQTKIDYINKLLEVGFDTVDCGSFVSAKAIPQMADSREIIPRLKPGKSRLLVIVANKRGAEEAVQFEHIACLGFPFSISPTFQMRNTNSTIEESWERVQDIQNICISKGKQLVIYISMGFGNPYGDPYNQEVVLNWANKIAAAGIQVISLADTVGMATPAQVGGITGALVPQYPQVQIGVHLHSTVNNWQAKIAAALEAGCLRFDGAMKGIGGCPMANDDLVGNMDTEQLIHYFRQQQLLPKLNESALEEAGAMAATLFQQPSLTV